MSPLVFYKSKDTKLRISLNILLGGQKIAIRVTLIRICVVMYSRLTVVSAHNGCSLSGSALSRGQGLL